MITLSIILFLLIIGLSLYDEGVQPGILAIAAGLFLAIGIAGWSYSDTIALFPTSLFLTLTGILLFFGAAVANGTIDNIAHVVLAKLPVHPALIPFFFGGAVVVLTAIGVGNIGAVAILAPAAMTISRKLQLKPFLMILLIVGAANAGALSPLAVTGILTRELMSARLADYGQLDLMDFGLRLFTLSFVVQTVVSIAGFFLLGGYRWMRQAHTIVLKHEKITWTRDQIITIVSIFAFVITILLCSLPIFPEDLLLRVWGAQVVAVSFLAVSVLLILRAVDPAKMIATVPWSSILMVTGIVMYIEISAKAGAIEMLTDTMIRVAPASMLHPIVFAFSAVLSAFSSSSGVVMPLFISLAPGLAGNPAAAADIVTGVAISAHLVDTSPLSSLGALCIAAAQTNGPVPGLYRSLLLWAVVMMPVGVVLSWLLTR